MAAQQFPVEAGHVLAFARAIGDTNPVYYSPQGAAEAGLEGIVAPPTFVQASSHFDPDYRLRPKIGEPWMGSASEPTGTARNPSGGVGLHAEQRYRYHRPVRVGDVLTGTSRIGNTWDKQGRRGGLLHFTETVTEYRDQHGELVVTATTVGVITGRPLEPADTHQDNT
jgi:acyl dehydratase